MSIQSIYLLIINITTFALYGIDKISAIKGGWRVRETVLIGMAVIGGSLGCIVAMYTFRHKTRKPVFTIGLPLILILQIAGILWFLFY